MREARQRLSVLLDQVRQGHEILITDRGRPVARLIAPLPLSVKPLPGRAAFRRTMPRLDPPLLATLGGENTARSLAARPAGPLYVDATGLALFYLPDAGSTALDRALRGRRDVIVSDLAVSELLAAFAGRRREVRAPGAAAQLQAALLEDADSGAYRKIDLSPPVHRAAERLALSLSATTSLRPTHALHLALAMTAGVAGIVTFDHALAAAAQALGLNTVPD